LINPVGVVILNDTDRIDPQIPHTQCPGGNNGVFEGHWQSVEINTSTMSLDILQLSLE
jgi:hypothetical protein